MFNRLNNTFLNWIKICVCMYIVHIHVGAVVGVCTCTCMASCISYTEPTVTLGVRLMHIGKYLCSYGKFARFRMQWHVCWRHLENSIFIVYLFVMKNDSNRSYDTHSFTWSHFSRPTIITLNVYTFVDSGKETIFFSHCTPTTAASNRIFIAISSHSMSFIFYSLDFLVVGCAFMCDSLDSWFNCASRDQSSKRIRMRKRIFITQSWNRIAWNAHRFSHTHRNGKRVGAENDIGNTVHNINFVDYHKFTFMVQLCSRWQLNMKRHRMRKTETTTETEMES